MTRVSKAPHRVGLVCQVSMDMSAWLDNSQILLFFSAQIEMLVSISRKTGTNTKQEKNHTNPGWTHLIIKHFLPPSYFGFQTPHFWPDSVCSAHRWEVHPSGEIASSISQKQPPQPTPPSLSHTIFSPLVTLQPRADPNTSFLVFFLMKRPFSHQWGTEGGVIKPHR